MKYVVTLRDKTYEVEVEEGQAMIVDEYEALAPAAPIAAVPAAAPVAAPTAATAAPAAPATVAAGTTVTAPLPGNVLAINVKEGDAVKAGDILLLIEAMKMENEVVAPSDGVVKQIVITKGQQVSTGDTLVVI